MAEPDYVVVDVEGNGQQPPDLVELAVVPVLAGAVGQPKAWLVRPPRPITPIARRIHGITAADVDGAPAFSAIAAEVRDQLTSRVLVAHNAGVDVAVLRRTMPDFIPMAVLDTLTLSRRLMPEQVNYRLGSLVKVLGLGDDLPAGLRPHRASYDALVTARLFLRLATDADGALLSYEQLSRVGTRWRCAEQQRAGRQCPVLKDFSSLSTARRASARPAQCAG